MKKESFKDTQIYVIPVEKVNTEKTYSAKVTLIRYRPDFAEQLMLDDFSHIRDLISSQGVQWFNINSIHNIDIIESIALQLNIHLLSVEDILDSEQRPKVDDYGKYLLFILKMIYLDPKSHRILIEQISCILFDHQLITVQETPYDVFSTIRKNILENKGRIRNSEADYLLHTIIDSIVDNYFIVLESVEENISQLEKKALISPHPCILQQVLVLKNNIDLLRKSIAPLTDILRYIQKQESHLISESRIPYFKDVYDNILRNIDSLKSIEERVSGIVDLYMSVVNHNTNLIIRILTVISSIFIPLTFIAGVYGMNFKYMPELEFRYGYFIVIGIMIVLGLSMLWFFKRKKWL